MSLFTYKKTWTIPVYNQSEFCKPVVQNTLCKADSPAIMMNILPILVDNWT